MNDLFSPHASAPDASYSIAAGSFRSLSLALLAFYPVNRTLQLVETVPAFGPHQYLATTPGRDYVYTTSWATPPILSSWKVKRTDDSHVESLEHVNTVSITATSSYINIPPPYTFIYSTGGPTGEVHLWDSMTGGIGSKIQRFLFVPEDELEKADKTRVALRFGSHGIEFSSEGYAFIPVLGTDTIEMYRRESDSGKLVHISSNKSPRGPEANDGPRHVKVHPNGKVVYCVTEHTNYVDVYEILQESLKHVSSHSILPPHLSVKPSADSFADPHTRSKYRGGTLLLTLPTPSHPAPTALLTTTRGATPSEKGWLSLFRLDASGHILSGPGDDGHQPQQPFLKEDPAYITRFETPTSSGKANALDVRLKDDGKGSGGIWILLTDDDKQADEHGAIRVLEWDGWVNANAHRRGVRIVAEWPSSGSTNSEGRGRNNETDSIPYFTGASHAIWLD